MRRMPSVLIALSQSYFYFNEKFHTDLLLVFFITYFSRETSAKQMKRIIMIETHTFYNSEGSMAPLCALIVLQPSR